MGRGSYRAARPLPVALAILFGATSACERDGAATSGNRAANTSHASGGASPATGASSASASEGAAPRTSQRELDEARAAAEQYLTTGRPAEAVVIARRLVEASPRGVAEHELLARALLAAVILDGDDGPTGATRAAAAHAYREAAALDPTNAPLQHAAGVALDQSGQLDEAVAHYHRAMAIDPSNPQYPLYIAMALRRLDRVDEALAMLDVARQLAPDEALVETVRADALLAAGNPEAALAAAQRARTLAPGDLQARVAEARALRRLERAQESAELLAALPHGARAIEAVAQELAESLLAIGRSEAAARAWELSLNTDPRRWRSAAGAADAWIAAGDLIRAEAHLDLARALAPRESRVVEVQARFDAARRSGNRSVP